jgi:hypothetical protein
MKQRIALVAVSALTTGLFSVVSAPVANAAAADVVVEANAAAGTAASSHLTGSGESQGNISGTVTVTDGTGAVTMFSNGILALDALAPTTNTKFTVLTVTGGTFSSVTTGGAITTSTIAAGAVGARFGVLATPTAAGTNMVIRSFNDATAATASTGGTAVAVVTVTVVPSLSLGANAGAAAVSATAPASFGIVGTPVATQAAQTAVMYDSGTLSLRLSRGTTAATRFGVVTVSGGTIVGHVGGGTLTGLTTYGHNGETGILIRPSAAGTSLVVKYFNNATAATSSTGGTEIDKLTVTVTTAANAGTWSASNSRVQAKVLANAAVAAVTSNADEAAAPYVPNGSAGIVAFSLNDAQNQPMSTSTLVSATATNGAVVSLDGVTYNTAISGTYGGTFGNVYVAQGVANTPVTSTVVTLSVGGTVYATKNFKLVGDVASITLSKAKIGKAGAANAAGFALEVKDSAGNLISDITPSASASSINASVNAVTPAASVNDDTAAQAFTCSAVRGTSTITYTFTNAANVRITSNALPVVCAGDPLKYTASLDKASYAQGSIATLTISATDADGKPVSDYSLLGTAGSPLAITCGTQMTAVTAPVNNSDVFTSGVKTYRYAVGTTAGSYNCVVDLTAWNASSTPQSAITVAYAITGDGGTSNADVLKAIVSLIASINKQIAALQKALLRR